MSRIRSNKLLTFAVALVILQIDSIGAGNVQSFTVSKTWDGYSLETRNDLIYWVALALGVGATLLSFLIVRSRLGLALQATRDSAGGAKADRACSLVRGAGMASR